MHKTIIYFSFILIKSCNLLKILKKKDVFWIQNFFSLKTLTAFCSSQIRNYSWMNNTYKVIMIQQMIALSA